MREIRIEIQGRARAWSDASGRQGSPAQQELASREKDLPLDLRGAGQSCPGR